MYAIIRTGGKQSKVSAGDVIHVELIKGTEDEITFTPLLVVDDKGTAITDRSKLEKMPVTAKILGQVKGDKIDIFKYKNKSGYRRRQGHRQRYSQIEIVSITKPRATKKKAVEATDAKTTAKKATTAKASDTKKASDNKKTEEA